MSDIQTSSRRKLSILRIDASARRAGSTTRSLANAYLAELDAAGAPYDLVVRDLADGVPFIDEAWVGANFTPDDQRTDAQKQALAASDALAAELKAADIVLIGAPVYNFAIPAALKAWIDMVARARLTFQYTESGPVGLLVGKRAIVFAATGGVEAGSPIDFATGYLRHVLGFLGIDDVEIIAADQQITGGEQVVATARAGAVAAARTVAQPAP